MPVISVILPTCDRPALVGRALASVLAQDGADFEVVLVDNNRMTPPVATQAALASLLADPRVRVVSAAAARTAGATRNVGLAEARGEWVTFLDDDDEYAPGKLARQLALARETGTTLVLCGYEMRLGARRRRIQTAATSFTGDGLLLDAIWGTPFLFMRRNPGLRFDETLAAAEDFCFAQDYLRRHGITRVPCVPEPLVVVHPQPGERVNARHEAHWRALRRGLGRCGAGYSRPARRLFLLRALLQRHKGPDGSWRRLVGTGCRLLRTGGAAEARRVLNACLYRTGWLRRWLVS